MANSLEQIPILSDVGRQPEIAMADYKTEVVITKERHEISARFQRILDIFDHAKHAGAIASNIRCRPTSDLQPEIAMVAYSSVCWPPSDNVGDNSKVLV